MLLSRLSLEPASRFGRHVAAEDKWFHPKRSCSCANWTLGTTTPRLSNDSASPTHQPNDHEPGRDCRGTGGAQRVLWHLRRGCEQLQAQVRRGCPQQTLDHAHEPHRNAEIVQPFGLAPTEWVPR